jgi:hypothetical protein
MVLGRRLREFTLAPRPFAGNKKGPVQRRANSCQMIVGALSPCNSARMHRSIRMALALRNASASVQDFAVASS